MQINACTWNQAANLSWWALILSESAFMSVEEAHKCGSFCNFSFAGPERGSQPSNRLNPGPPAAHMGCHKKGAVVDKSEWGDAAWDAAAEQACLANTQQQPVGVRHQQAAIRGKNNNKKKKKSSDTWLPVTHPACLCVANKHLVHVWGSYFKMCAWPSRKRLWQQRRRLRARAPTFKTLRPLMNCLSQTNDTENTSVIMELKKKTSFPKQHHHQNITFRILIPATTTLKHSQIDTLEFF